MTAVGGQYDYIAPSLPVAQCSVLSCPVLFPSESSRGIRDSPASCQPSTYISAYLSSQWQDCNRKPDSDEWRQYGW